MADIITYGCIAVALLGAYLWGVRSERKQREDYETLFLSRFSGIMPVFCDGPNDVTVLERAEAWREKFKAHGNEKAVVVAYPFNKVINGQVTMSTITADYQNTMIAFCSDYIAAVEKLHLEAYKHDPRGAAAHFSGQYLHNINKNYTN